MRPREKKQTVMMFEGRRVTGGRPLSEYYVKLGFKSAKMKNSNGILRNAAVCLICNTNIRNTSGRRLQAHRNVCYSEKYKNKFQKTVKSHSSVDAEDSPNEDFIDSGDNQTQQGTQHLSRKRTSSKSDEKSKNINIPNYKPAKRGRKEGRHYDVLGFICNRMSDVFGKLRTVATCVVCNKHVHNTSVQRLLTHRKMCVSEKYKVDMTNKDILLLCGDDSEQSTNEDHEEIANNEESHPSCSTKFRVVQENREVVTSTISNLSNVEDAIANFIFGCGLPLSVVESAHFKRLIATLNPTYFNELPKSDELSVSLLTHQYKKCLENGKKLWTCSVSAMILDTVECKNGQKFLVALLQDAISSTNVFLNCLELTNTPDQESIFKNMMLNSIRLAKVLYNTDVYAVVTDKLTSNGFPSRCNNVWYIPSQSSFAKILLKDLLATLNYKMCIFKANCIVDSVKNVQFKKQLSYRKSLLDTDVDNLYFITDNWDTLQETLCGGDTLNVDHDVILAFSDLKFKKLCYSCSKEIKSLHTFIQRLTSPSCSLADSMILWQNFVKHPVVQNSKILRVLANEKLKSIKREYSLIAHYFGEGRPSHFSEDEHKIIKGFLNNALSEHGKIEFLRFDNCEHPARDDFYKSSDFWEMMINEAPELSQFALKMLRLPCSSSIIKEIFSDFSTNGIISKGQCNQLMAVYFNLKVRES